MTKDQFDMFGGEPDKAHARHGDPDTSHDAAAETTHRIRALQQAVLAFAAQCSAGFLALDLNDHFGVTSSTYRTRRSELVDKGLITDSGERRAVGGKGRKHAVWKITPAGRSEWLRLGLQSLDRAA